MTRQKMLIIGNVWKFMKKFIKIIVFILGLSLTTTACSTKKDNEEVKITLQFDICDLTDEEFKSIGTKGIENATKDDFKNIEFKLDVKHSAEISNRKITVPSIKGIIKSKYEDRYWFGKGYSQDNIGESFAEYGEDIMFYSAGLEEEEIKEMFKSSEIKISWTTDAGKRDEEIFHLGDYIQFR